jgi:hypothetical protein
MTTTLASKVSAAQDALLALLADAEALADYEIGFGTRYQHPEREIFVSEGATTERQTPFSADSGFIAQQDEAFTLSVFIHVHRTNLPAIDVRDIADAAEAAVMAALAADPTLSGTVAFCAVTATERAGGFWDEKGAQRFSDRRIDVKCQAYLG